MSLCNVPYHSIMVTQILENPRWRMCAGRQRGLSGPRASWQGSSIWLVGVSMQLCCAMAGSDCSFSCQTSAFCQEVRHAMLVIVQDNRCWPESGSVLAETLVPGHSTRHPAEGHYGSCHYETFHNGQCHSIMIVYHASMIHVIREC